MISKALDACTLPTPVEDYSNEEAHHEFMEDVRQRQSDPKNSGYMSSGDQARRNAIFMAARASGNEAALDPEARPASSDLPFELESHEEYMASLTTSDKDANSSPGALPFFSEGDEDFSSPVTSLRPPFRVSKPHSGFVAYVGNAEEPMSERARKRAAFFHSILGTDTDDSDEEFVPRAISYDSNGSSSSSDDWSSDSDDDTKGLSSRLIISALPSQEESALGPDLPSSSSVLDSDEDVPLEAPQFIQNAIDVNQEREAIVALGFDDEYCSLLPGNCETASLG
jgi:hypothetical protein